MKRKNKSILFLIFIFSISIGYAIINRTLTINGNSEVRENYWDIHFKNVKVTDGSVEALVPAIDNTKLRISFSFNLDLPGDFYEFTVDIVNAGTIDAMIDSIIKTPELTTTQEKYLKYIIEYQNREEIKTKQLVKSNEAVRLKVRVEYRTDLNAEDLPTTSVALNLGFEVNYIQADNTGITVKDNGKIINVVSGDGTNTSDEVCIGEECFYVMYSDDDSITMLSKYNLYVGGEYSNGWTAYGEEATGKQDSNMLGYVAGQTVMKGTSAFSTSNYWSSTVSSYPSYVYNENSLLYSYVENYKTYLSTLGVTPIEARLITYEELKELGCGSDCSSAPSWVYATSYWLGTANYIHSVYRLSSSGSMMDEVFSDEYDLGCRPVIVISKSELIDLIQFEIKNIIYYAEDGMTWGEWVNSEYNTANYQVLSNNNVYNYAGQIVSCNSALVNVNTVIDANLQCTWSGNTHNGGT